MFENRMQSLKVSNSGQSRIAKLVARTILCLSNSVGNQKKTFPWTQIEVTREVTRVGNEPDHKAAYFQTPHFLTKNCNRLYGAAVHVFDRPVRKQPNQNHRRIFSGFATAQELVHQRRYFNKSEARE